MNVEENDQTTPEAPPPPPSEAPPSEAPPSEAPPSETPATDGGDKDANMWAMFVHFSLLVGFVIPYVGWVVPIILWQVKKNDMPSIDAHGKIVVNWIISALIYSVVCFILTFLIIGIFGFIALAIMTFVFAIIGGIKANNGEVWPYPLSLKLIK